MTKQNHLKQQGVLKHFTIKMLTPDLKLKPLIIFLMGKIYVKSVGFCINLIIKEFWSEEKANKNTNSPKAKGRKKSMDFFSLIKDEFPYSDNWPHFFPVS